MTGALGLVWQIERPVFGQPRDRVVARRIQHDAAAIHEEDAVHVREWARGALLRDDDRALEPLDGVEERVRRRRIDLRRRLVQQEQARLEREGRRECDALKLSARQLGSPALGEVPGADQLQRLVDPRPDVGRRDAEVLEAERDLVRDLRHHDLVFRILKDRRDVAGKLGRARLARVSAGHDDAPRERAAVEVRHEARQCAQEARLAGSRRPEQRDALSFLDSQRHVAQHRLAAGVCEAKPFDLG